MTIKDIARLAGVSVSTVSRVLNNHPDVSQDAVKKVMAIVNKYNYIPNTSARNLGMSSSDNIGVIMRGISNPFYTKIITAIGDKIEKSGYTMVMQQISTDEDELRVAAMMEKDKRLQGLILLGGHLNYTKEQVASIGVPFVCCTFSNEYGNLNSDQYSSVCIDDEATAFSAVEQLYKRGHKKIAVLLSAVDDGSVSQVRYAGYKRALKEFNIPEDDNLIIQIHSFNIADAYHEMNKWLDKGIDFSALFCISDNMAMGAMKALRDAKKIVPDDVAVIAIDGIEASEYTNPVLSTLCQPMEHIGIKAVDVLVDIIDNEGPHQHLTLPTTLREGETLR